MIYLIHKIPKLINIIFCISILFCIIVGETVTQEGTDAGNFLKLETGIKGIGMGGAHVATANNISGVTYNPAGIAFTTGSDFYFSYRSYLVDITIGSIGYAKQLSPTNYFGLYLFYLDSGEMLRTTAIEPDGGLGTFKVQDLVLSAIYSQILTDRLKLGVSFKYIREDIDQTAFNGIALDVGSIFDTGIYGLILGMSVSNFGPAIQFHGEGLENTSLEELDPNLWSTKKWNLPLIFRMGISKEILGKKSDLFVNQDNTLVMEIDAVSPSDAGMYGSLGVEYSWKNILYLRTGSYLNHDTASLAFGGGINYSLNQYSFKMDYAFANFSILENTHQFAISLGF